MFSDRVSASTSISTIFAPYDLPRSTLDDLTVHLSRSSKLPDFLMHFQHTLEEPSGSRAMMCAFTIASGYFIGGFIPLIPYFLVAEHQVVAALCLSSVIMIIALFLFGYGKTCFVSGWRGPMNVRKAVINCKPFQYSSPSHMVAPSKAVRIQAFRVRTAILKSN